MPANSPDILRAEFIYRNDVANNILTKGCTKPRGQLEIVLGAAAVNLAVGLAVKAAESILDTVALRLQPEVMVFEATIPLKGLFSSDGDGGLAINDGCLVFYSVSDQELEYNDHLKDIKLDNIDLMAVFQVTSSHDGTAFRFDVRRWHYKSFVGNMSRRWTESSNERDIALKIEFLTPGSAALGTRTVFIENIFSSVDTQEIGLLFEKDQQLPWFAVPSRLGTSPAPFSFPVNLKVTLVETTRPNALGLFLQDFLKSSRADILSLVKDTTRRAVDPTFEAGEVQKLAEGAGTAYGAYMTAWDALNTHKASKPSPSKLPASEPEEAEAEVKLTGWKAQFTIKEKIVSAKRIVAQSAFGAAGLPWPGNLP